MQSVYKGGPHRLRSLFGACGGILDLGDQSIVYKGRHAHWVPITLWFLGLLDHGRRQTKQSKSLIPGRAGTPHSGGTKPVFYLRVFVCVFF